MHSPDRPCMDHPRRESVAAIQDVQRLPRPTEASNGGSEVMDMNEWADKLDGMASSTFFGPDKDALRQAAVALSESEGWRRDAERYKWLTKNAYVGETYTHQGTVFEVHGCDREVPIDDDVDAAIDAARKEGV